MPRHQRASLRALARLVAQPRYRRLPHYHDPERDIRLAKLAREAERDNLTSERYIIDPATSVLTRVT